MRRPLDEIGEDESIERFFYKSITDGVKTEKNLLYTYSIKGDAAVFDNWKIISEEEIMHPFY